MKNKSLLIISFSILPFLLIGQSEENRKINIGIGAGVSQNNVFNHVYGAEFESKLSSILITVNAQKPLSNKWSIFSELDYIHKGPKGFNINYLVFSILPEYKIISNPDISILGGPYIGYMFKYKAFGSIFEHPDLKNYDLGIDAGINFTKRINQKISFFIFPRIEVGMIRFSFSNHFSYQLKTGLRF